MVIVIGIAAVIVIIVGATFVGRHEAQLTAEAERASLARRPAAARALTPALRPATADAI